jgi:hypothetical protein
MDTDLEHARRRLKAGMDDHYDVLTKRMDGLELGANPTSRAANMSKGGTRLERSRAPADPLSAKGSACSNKRDRVVLPDVRTPPDHFWLDEYQ